MSTTTDDKYVGKNVGAKTVGNSINPVVLSQQFWTINNS